MTSLLSPRSLGVASWALVAAFSAPLAVVADVEICWSPSNTFTAKVNIHAGRTGYFMFEECGDMVNPTLAMEVGETYTFLQTDRSNYHHPLGFAYFADGSHDDVFELAPGISGSPKSCDSEKTCPSPMYFVGGKYQGTYSNIPAIAPPTTEEANSGLEFYELWFSRPMQEWAQAGEFTIQLKFDDHEYTQDIFYFCHIHQYMTGRIKLMRDGHVIQQKDGPAIPYSYEVNSEFDQSCGTNSLEHFHPSSNAQCAKEGASSICGTEEASPALQSFSVCLDAMNCKMKSDMKTGVSSDSAAALFIHQTIPQHQSLVNRAKALLQTNTLKCHQIGYDNDPDCALESMLWEMINTQNKQIQTMLGYLEERGYPDSDRCYEEAVVAPPIISKKTTTVNTPPKTTAAASLTGTAMNNASATTLNAKQSTSTRSNNSVGQTTHTSLRKGGPEVARRTVELQS